MIAMRALLLVFLFAISTCSFRARLSTKPVRFVCPSPPVRCRTRSRARSRRSSGIARPAVRDREQAWRDRHHRQPAKRRAAAPDAHTIVMTTNSTLAAAGALYKKLQYDPLKDFAPIMLISKTSMILLVRPDFPRRR